MQNKYENVTLSLLNRKFEWRYRHILITATIFRQRIKTFVFASISFLLNPNPKLKINPDPTKNPVLGWVVGTSPGTWWCTPWSGSGWTRWSGTVLHAALKIIFFFMNMLFSKRPLSRIRRGRKRFPWGRQRFPRGITLFYFNLFKFICFTDLLSESAIFFKHKYIEAHKHIR